MQTIINFIYISFMIEKFISNNIENEECLTHEEDFDYKLLIIRLKVINQNIALLEKIIFS